MPERIAVKPPIAWSSPDVIRTMIRQGLSAGRIAELTGADQDVIAAIKRSGQW